MGRQSSSLGMELCSGGTGHCLVQGDPGACQLRSAPGCHAHLGRLPVLGLNLGGVRRAPLQLERGGDAGEEEEGK